MLRIANTPAKLHIGVQPLLTTLPLPGFASPDPWQRFTAQPKLGALLVNRAAARFILRSRCAGSKGCAPACPGVNQTSPRISRLFSGALQWAIAVAQNIARDTKPLLKSPPRPSPKHRQGCGQPPPLLKSQVCEPGRAAILIRYPGHPSMIETISRAAQLLGEDWFG